MKTKSKIILTFAGMYKVVRSLLFMINAERAHYLSMNAFRIFSNIPVIKNILRNAFKPPSRPVTFCGLSLINPVGLGAGFDKNARYLDELGMLGFGFVEIGTVTPVAQSGNEKPRLFRLPADKALINRMGFNNDGAEAIAERLKNWRERNKTTNLIIGGNIGKNKQTSNDDAWKDYLTCFKALYPYVDYFVVNVSSPNTPGLRALQDKDSLKKILDVLQEENRLNVIRKPLLLKIAPDLTTDQVNDVIDLVMEINLDGLIVANTTIDRSGLKTSKADIDQAGAGGLSGKPLAERSTSLVEYISNQSVGKINIVASGGIFNAKDAADKRKAGATLIQVWTGFIYEGPSIVKNICKGL